MIRDPLYRAIEERLGDDLDPDLFERCAVELLRPDYPGLTPIRGGGDAGMDGSIASPDAPPLPLVCTTSSNVLGNLTRSLTSYVAEGGESRFAVVVTSEALTPKRRRNLEKRAKELGFTLRNVHARDDLVGRLYQAPVWRKELLGLTGEPPALSVFPRTRRPFSAIPLIGRDDDVAWLHARGDDCLLIGQPGSGKTAILASLGLTDDGAFLASDVRAEIADAIRQQRPGRIFVDDAHRRHDQLVELIALRDELDADYAIVASCWPAESGAIQRILELGAEGVRSLHPLPRTEVAEIVKAVGIAGPEGLVGEILNQAAGLPGLAVTLAQLCMRSGTRDLARGDFLLKDITETLEELVAARAVPILAAFSVGGRSGFSLDDVADALRLPPAEVWDTITRLDSGGIVREVGQGNLAVEPPALREALIRDVFFAGAKSLRIVGLLAKTSSPANTAEALFRSGWRGATVPQELLQPLLERCIPGERWGSREDERAWVLYAYTGPDAVRWILDQHPELLQVIARPGLMHLPERVIPLLLDAAVGDNRELPPNPEHPLRLLSDWVKGGEPGTDGALGRRRHLLDAITAWAPLGRSTKVVLRAVAIAFSPEYEASPADPVNPRMIRIWSAHLTGEELRTLVAWWPEAVRVLEAVGVEELRDLDNVVRDWAFPSRLRGGVTDEFVAIARTGAARMLEDIARAGSESPAVVAWAARLAARPELDVALPELDPVYEVLFPREEHGEDWKAVHARQLEAAQSLGRTWAERHPEEVAAVFLQYEAEAARIEHRWPRHSDTVARVLADRSSDPLIWVDAFVARDAAADLVAPFLWRAFEGDRESAEPMWRRLLDTEKYRYIALEIGLRHEHASHSITAQTLANLEGAERLVQVACLRGQVPEDRLIRLLEHPSATVAGAAAEGAWRDRDKGEALSDELRRAWQEAFIRHVREPHVLREAFKRDPQLAKEWLLARRVDDVVARYRDDGAFSEAAAALDPNARRDLLGTLDEDYGTPGFYASLVAGDTDLFEVLLAREDLRSVHLEPLRGHPNPSWIELAKLALAAGHTPEELAHAVHGLGWSWTGNLSDMWKGWATSFRALEAHEDARIREVGRIGREHAEACAAVERERERREDVYGID